MVLYGRLACCRPVDEVERLGHRRRRGCCPPTGRMIGHGCFRRLDVPDAPENRLVPTRRFVIDSFRDDVGDGDAPVAFFRSLPLQAHGIGLRHGLRAHRRPGRSRYPFPREHAHRVCGVCGNDCAPDSAGANGLGVRIVFVCPDHGVQSIVDPFEDQR